MDYAFEFVEKNTSRYKHVKDLIKSKGENICRDAMDKITISKELKESEFAFIVYNKNIKNLEGFIVCSELDTSALEIRLLCALEGLNLGNKLLDEVITYSKNKGYKRLTLNALNIPKLIEWYKKQGFQLTGNLKYNIQGKIIEQEMEMYL